MIQDQIEPITFFSTTIKEYSPTEVEQCLEQVWSQLARDGNGRVSPHCSILEYIMPTQALFCASKCEHGHFKLTAYVFETDTIMNMWQTQFGEDRIIDTFYNRL